MWIKAIDIYHEQMVPNIQRAGIGAGLESMIVNSMDWEGSVNPKVKSHRKAVAATASGKFKDEIRPVKIKIVDPKTGDKEPVTISVDDGIRPNASIVDLGKLKPVFKKDGTTTSGK
ncbi:unnamed protein product [Fraxinus pennsylvanica]|uniref:Thiolase N-terminal domain-containing protein n=1 Tax=Fraxinus pennsylvanica TaxID=56036 RepID=A0AAD2A667_9LAMI|nr:unnamed protein product [Fraxinus pennsylvanica]